MYIIVIMCTIMLLKTFNSYLFQTLLVHHHGVHCYFIKQLLYKITITVIHDDGSIRSETYKSLMFLKILL